MASKKATKVKKDTVKSPKKGVKPVVAEVEEHDNETEADISSPKSKIAKPLEVDPTDILPEVDEKAVDEENPLLALDDEDSEDAISLDSEDLNPFGDKWEE